MRESDDNIESSLMTCLMEGKKQGIPEIEWIEKRPELDLWMSWLYIRSRPLQERTLGNEGPFM